MRNREQFQCFFSDPSMNAMMREVSRNRLLEPHEVTFLARKTQQYERWQAERSALAADLGREPEDSEMAHRLGLAGAREFREGLRASLGAKHLLVSSNLRLVYSVARGFTDRGLSLQDLVQEGALGMLRATEKYDPERGNALSTYATYWIRQHIRRALANSARDIRLPVHTQEKLKAMRTVRWELFQELGRSPTRQQVARRMGLALDKVAFLERAGLATVSYDKLMDMHFLFHDVLAPALRDDAAHASLERRDLEAHVRRLLASELSAVEARVVRLRFGLELDGRGRPQPSCTLEEVGRRLHITREQARYAERRAFRKLRSSKGFDDLRGAGYAAG